MRLCSIASGSSGNCIYVGSEQTHLLVDTGISGSRIENGLNEIGLRTGEIEGILITHEHSDHICGLGVLARRYQIPIYATRGSIAGIMQLKQLGRIDSDLFREISYEEDFSIGDIRVSPFAISHDAAQPSAYVFRQNGHSVGIATDLGTYDDYVVDKLQDLDVLFLEANHDIHMLQVGSYPYYLKQRILGKGGHLSNEVSGQLLCRVLHDGFKRVMLGHLSQENNYEDLAYEAVRLEIDLGDNPYKANDFPIHVAKRESSSPVIAF
jgi:phosphoribosyl 1,2-cyclic phosphodiesterase